MISDKELVVTQTKNWIKNVVIDCNFCPFASKPFMQKSIQYSVQLSFLEKEISNLLKQEFEFLDENKNIETGFIIFPNDFKDFQEYLSLVKKAEQTLSKLGYDGIYQVASFHPDYLFADAEEDDPANYTNRSMYPMLHLLREDSITKALSLFKEPESIPEKNVSFAREKGLKYMQVLRSTCL